MILGYSIRPASSDDVQKLEILEKKLQKAPWTGAQFLAELEKPFSQTWVVTDDETDEKVIAFLVFWDLNDEIYLLNLGVEPDFHRRGVGSALFEAMVNEGIRSRKRRVILEVRKSNDRAVKLYQKKKLSISQIRKSFYSDGEDAYIMELPLREDGLVFN